MNLKWELKDIFSPIFAFRVWRGWISNENWKKPIYPAVRATMWFGDESQMRIESSNIVARWAELQDIVESQMRIESNLECSVS